MRRSLSFIPLAGMLLAGLVMSAARAEAAFVEFRGAFVITGATQACLDDGWVIGDSAFARFAPAGLGDNGATTRYSFFFQSFASNYTLATGGLTSTFKGVKGTSIGRSGLRFDAEMRITSQSPATITPTTNFVTLVGQIKGPEALAGCTLSFRSSLSRLP